MESLETINAGASTLKQNVNGCSGGTTAPAQLHLHVLGSGSKGNCALIEGPQGLIMIDNGFSRREALGRMHQLGLSERNVCALIITHEHSDHVKGVGVWTRAFSTPVFAAHGTMAARASLKDIDAEEFDPGDELVIAGVRVQTFSTSHDVTNPCGMAFSLDSANDRSAGADGTDTIGFVTDTGVLGRDAASLLYGSRILALESNHDVSMLRCGPYPRQLQNRILSDYGHLSNEQAADAAAKLISDNTQSLVAMHISQENNRPSLAVRALAHAVGAQLDNELGSSATLERDCGAALKVRAAGQNRPLTLL